MAAVVRAALIILVLCCVMASSLQKGSSRKLGHRNTVVGKGSKYGRVRKGDNLRHLELEMKRRLEQFKMKNKGRIPPYIANNAALAKKYGEKKRMRMGGRKNGYRRHKSVGRRKEYGVMPEPKKLNQSYNGIHRPKIVGSHSLSEKIELMCRKVQLRSPIEKIYFMGFSRAMRKTNWMDCCADEDKAERLSCFYDIMMEKLEKMCVLRKKHRFQACCKVTGDARKACVDKHTQQAYRGKDSPVAPKVPQKYGKAKSQVRDFPPYKQQQRKHHGRPSRKMMFKKYLGGNETTERPDVDANVAGRKRLMKAARKCCAAGRLNLTSESENQTAVDVCEVNYGIWSQELVDLPHFCADKFVWCCLNNVKPQTEEVDEPSRNMRRPGKRGKHHGGKGKPHHGWRKQKGKWNKQKANIFKGRNIKISMDLVNASIPTSAESPEVPDETGQQIEEHMEEEVLSVTFKNKERECCMAGKNRRLSYGGRAGKRECLTGRAIFAEEWPLVDRECSHYYLKCCMWSEKRADDKRIKSTQYKSKAAAKNVSANVPEEKGAQIKEPLKENVLSLALGIKERECCMAGKNFRLSYGGKASKQECVTGLAVFGEKWPLVDEECSGYYFKCCVISPYNAAANDKADDKTKAKSLKKVPVDWGYKDKDGRLPHGMVKSPSGQHYIVDKIPPGVKRGRTVPRRP